MVHPRKSALFTVLERASGGMNGIIRSWYDHIPEQEGGFNPDHSPARLPRVIIRHVRGRQEVVARLHPYFPSIRVHAQKITLLERCRRVFEIFFFSLRQIVERDIFVLFNARKRKRTFVENEPKLVFSNDKIVNYW